MRSLLLGLTRLLACLLMLGGCTDHSETDSSIGGGAGSGGTIVGSDGNAGSGDGATRSDGSNSGGAPGSGGGSNGSGASSGACGTINTSPFGSSFSRGAPPPHDASKDAQGRHRSGENVAQCREQPRYRTCVKGIEGVECFTDKRGRERRKHEAQLFGSLPANDEHERQYDQADEDVRDVTGHRYPTQSFKFCELVRGHEPRLVPQSPEAHQTSKECGCPVDSTTAAHRSPFAFTSLR